MKNKYHQDIIYIELLSSCVQSDRKTVNLDQRKIINTHLSMSVGVGMILIKFFYIRKLIKITLTIFKLIMESGKIVIFQCIWNLNST